MPDAIDAFDNLVSSGYSATATLGTDNNGNVTSLANATRTAVGGKFTFSSMVLAAKVGTYRFVIDTLVVTKTSDSSTVTPSHSLTTRAFTLTHGEANKLTVITDAAGANSGAKFTTQPIVEVQDADGNPVTTGAAADAAITMGVDAGTTVVSNSITATVGRANFQTADAGQKLGITGVIGTRTLTYTASFASTQLTATQTITLAAGAAAKLGYRTGANATVQPGTVEAGELFPNAPTVEVQDAQGNLVTNATNSVVANLYKAGVAVSAQTSTKAASGGIATFDATKFTVEKGTDYSLVYTAAGLTDSLATDTFTVTNGAAKTVRFTTNPVAIGAGISYTTFVAGTSAADAVPALEVVDAAGNKITSGSEAVLTASLTNTDGTAVVLPAGVTTATLLSGKSVTTVNGAATFGSLIIRATAGQYKLTISGTVDGVAVPFSAEYTITVQNGVLSTAVIKDPSVKTSVASRATISPIIEFQDSYANAYKVRYDSGHYGDTSNGISPTITATAPVGTTIVNGTFGNLLNGQSTTTGMNLQTKVGDKQITFDVSAPLASTVSLSKTWAVTAGAAAGLAVVQQPLGSGASSAVKSGVAFATQPKVSMVDADGNLVAANANAVVTASVDTSIEPSAFVGTIGGTTTATIQSDGTATFSNLSFTGLAGSSAHRLKFTVSYSSATKTALTDDFYLGHGRTSKLAFTSAVTASTTYAGLREAVWDSASDTYFGTDVDYFAKKAYSYSQWNKSEINQYAMNWAKDNFNLQFTGYFRPTESGTFTFRTASDDSSYVWIGESARGNKVLDGNYDDMSNQNSAAKISISDNRAVVANRETIDHVNFDGTQDSTVTGSVYLQAGKAYPIRIILGEQGGGNYVTFSWHEIGRAHV